MRGQQKADRAYKALLKEYSSDSGHLRVDDLRRTISQLRQPESLRLLRSATLVGLIWVPLAMLLILAIRVGPAEISQHPLIYAGVAGGFVLIAATRRLPLSSPLLLFLLSSLQRLAIGSALLSGQLDLERATIDHWLLAMAVCFAFEVGLVAISSFYFWQCARALGLPFLVFFNFLGLRGAGGLDPWLDRLEGACAAAEYEASEGSAAA